MEEATLRAKIQAMKNLLEAKRKRGGGAVDGRGDGRSSGFHTPSRKVVRPNTGPVNRTWTRFPSPSAASKRSVVGSGSANKVWRREDATVGKNQAWRKLVEVAASKSVRPTLVKRAGKSMQVQMLQLEDGEYAKANGGFSLVRSGVKPAVAADAVQTTSPTTAAVSVSRTNNSVNIGGVKYVLANGGKMLKRCSVGDLNKAMAATKHHSFSAGTKSVAARAALARAKAAVQRARTKRQASKKGVKVRTEYCSFYNRFGFCKNQNKCRFIHDSRRVAMCRKFLRNECNDPKCLLSHQNDENKVPVCKMFLRGSCTREGCKYRHVKVSATADICEAFTKGYCPKGDACAFRHELPTKKRKTTPATTSSSGNGSNGKSPKMPGTLSSPCSTSPLSAAGGVDSKGTSASSTSPKDSSASEDSSTDGKMELSIRPNIRFAPKHSAGFPSLFEGLRQASK